MLTLLILKGPPRLVSPNKLIMHTGLVLLLVATHCCTAAVEVAKNFKMEGSMEQPRWWGFGRWPPWSRISKVSIVSTAMPSTPSPIPKDDYVEQALALNAQMEADVAKMKADLKQSLDENTKLAARKQELQVQLEEDYLEHQKHLDSIHNSTDEVSDGLSEVTEQIEAQKQRSAEDLNALNTELVELKGQNEELRGVLTGELKELVTKKHKLDTEIKSLQIIQREKAEILESNKTYMDEIVKKTALMHAHFEPLKNSLAEEKEKNEELRSRNQQLEASYQKESTLKQEAEKQLNETQFQESGRNTTKRQLLKTIASKRMLTRRQQEALDQLDGEVAQVRLVNLHMKQEHESATAAAKAAVERKQQTEAELKQVMPQIQSMRNQQNTLKEILEGKRRELSHLQNGEETSKHHAISTVQNTTAEIMSTYSGIIEKFKARKPHALRTSHLVTA